MGYYNSPMHKKVVQMKKYSSEERTKKKKEKIQAQREKKEKRNPYQGLVGFLQALKSALPKRDIKTPQKK